jgi:hypothetical protein
MRLVGKAAVGGSGMLIDPGGSPDKSVLYLKLTPNPPFGAQMPFVGNKLDTTTIGCVAAWIETLADGGAPSSDSDSGEGGSIDATMADSSGNGAPDVSMTQPDVSMTQPEGGDDAESSDGAAGDSDTTDAPTE